MSAHGDDRRGRIVFDGPVAEITRRFGSGRTISVTLAEPSEDAEPVARAALAGVADEVSSPDPHTLRVTFTHHQATPGEVVSRLVQVFEVADLSVEGVSTEAIVSALRGLALRRRNSANGGKDEGASS